MSDADTNTTAGNRTANSPVLEFKVTTEFQSCLCKLCSDGTNAGARLHSYSIVVGIDVDDRIQPGHIDYRAVGDVITVGRRGARTHESVGRRVPGFTGQNGLQFTKICRPYLVTALCSLELVPARLAQTGRSY